MDRPTPRMNSATLQSCPQGQIVRVIGKVMTLTDDEAILQCTDGGQITVELTPQTGISDTFVETIGKYQGDMRIHELVSELTVMLSKRNTDLELADKAVQLTHTLPEVFPTE
ncbi:hypothetical protein JCM3765_001873 [Sporobolomyces pararoseus]